MAKPNARRDESKSGESAAADLAFDDQHSGSDTAPETPARASAAIHASNCIPNQQCPFTDKCSGRLHAFQTITTHEAGPDGKARPVKKQQLRCPKCGRMAEGFRVIGGPAPRGSQLFDRVKAAGQ